MYDEYETWTAFVANSFFEDSPTLKDKRSFTCLADYIECWIEAGDGLKQCGNSYESFQAVVIVIFHIWTMAMASGDPDAYIIDGLFREGGLHLVKGLLPAGKTHHRILERPWFEYHVAHAR